VKLENGHAVDRYLVERPLGQGGMASVYLVRHNQLGTLHALKVLDQASANLQERLLREGRVQARLRHPNVVNVSDVIDIQGSPGLLMEFVEGGDLGAWTRAHPRLLNQRLTLFGEIVAGGASAHAMGIVHRDLKPANILMAPTESGWQPKVTDFGLATPQAHESDAGLTQTGVQMGTPAYMAPEQVRNAKEVDHRADVFALGCILYELVCGVRAFQGEDTFEVFRGIVDGVYPNPVTLNATLPGPVVNAIEGCLLPELDERIPDCATLIAVLAGDEEWFIPQRQPAADTLFFPPESSDNGPGKPAENPPFHPDSLNTLPPPKGGGSAYGHWILLVVVLLCTLTGLWWVRRGAQIERPRKFDAAEIAARRLLADPVVADPVVADPVVADPVVADPVLAKPKVSTGFRVPDSSGTVRVALSKRGVRYPAGEVPVGTYTIQVSFDEGGVRYGGNATIQEGIVSVIQCDKATLSCTVTP